MTDFETEGKLGQYDCRNFTEINVFEIDLAEQGIVILHEQIHMLLTQSTHWGSIGYMLRKINIIDDKSHVSKFLFNSTQKIQEGTAVFFELMYILNTQGETALRKKIASLKHGNPEYYSHVAPLLVYIEYLKTCNYSLKIANKITTLVFQIAFNALNTPIHELDPDYFKSSSGLSKLQKNIDINHGYLPNPLFKKLIKSSIKLINDSDYDDFDVEAVLTSIINFEIQKKYLSDVSFRESESAKTKSFILSLYDESIHLNRINAYLETVSLKEHEIEDAICYTVPNSFRQYTQDVLLNDVDLEKAFSLAFRHGLFFIYGRYTTVLDSLRTRQRVDVNILATPFSEYEQPFLAAILDFKHKRNSASFFSDDGLLHHISTTECPIVISYKTFDFNKYCISGLPKLNRDIYIYCDRAYPYSIEYINLISANALYSVFISYDIVDVLLIKFDHNLFFFLPIVPVVHAKVLKDVRDGKLQISVSNWDDNGQLVEKNILPTFDRIMNNLFML